MDRHNIVAVFNTRSDAERAVQELVSFGIPAEDIRLSAADAELGTASTTARPEDWSQERHHGFWDWLLETMSRRMTAMVRSQPARGKDGLIRASARCGATGPGIRHFGEVQSHRYRRGGICGSNGSDPPPPAPRRAPGLEQRTAGMRTEAPEMTREGEQVIPVVKEELAVGKRTAERRYRIRSYVVETPVEEQVRLRDERVIIEHRPASGTVPNDPDALREREFEVVERHEEPVVDKRARPVEDVVVRREGNERVETVRDTVRETKVDVDEEPAEHQIEGERPVNPRRR